MARLRGRYSCALGIVIALQGINLVALLKVIVGQNLRMLSPLTMVLSLVFLVDYRKARNLLYVKYTWENTFIVLYLLFVTILAFFSDYSLLEPAYGFVYQLIYLLTIIVLWNNDERIDMDLTYNFLYWTSGILCTVAMVLILMNFISTGSVYFQGLGRDSSGNLIITRATIASIAYFLLASVLSKKMRSNADRVINIFFLIVAVAVAFVSRRRTVYIASVLMLLAYLIQKRRKLGKTIKKRDVIRVMIAVGCVLIVFFALSAINTTAAILDKGMNSLQKGLSTFLGRSNDDVAARIRYERLQRVPREFFFNSSISAYLFGNGYMAEWLDLPLIQAFNDIGILGACFFLSAFLIAPFSSMFYLSDKPFVVFTQFYCIAQITYLIGSGIPYGSMFFPMALMVFSVKVQKQSQTHTADHLRCQCGTEQCGEAVGEDLS